MRVESDSGGQESEEHLALLHPAARQLKPSQRTNTRRLRTGSGLTARPFITTGHLQPCRHCRRVVTREPAESFSDFIIITIIIFTRIENQVVGGWKRQCLVEVHTSIKSIGKINRAWTVKNNVHVESLYYLMPTNNIKNIWVHHKPWLDCLLTVMFIQWYLFWWHGNIYVDRFWVFEDNLCTV